MFTVKLRKKLTMTILTLIVNWVVVYLTNKGIELSPEQQLHLIEAGMAVSAVIVGLFNYGQGLADKGKEAAQPDGKDSK